jgi:hypothetical protein
MSVAKDAAAPPAFQLSLSQLEIKPHATAARNEAESGLL